MPDLYTKHINIAQPKLFLFYINGCFHISFFLLLVYVRVSVQYIFVHIHSTAFKHGTAYMHTYVQRGTYTNIHILLTIQKLWENVLLFVQIESVSLRMFNEEDHKQQFSFPSTNSVDISFSSVYWLSVCVCLCVWLFFLSLAQ